ncbi:CBS domain-containing protein [Actinomadura chokoriensis]|uniref:CBS domain-containing protein n=1 Tax=Actinomadura chokoriensis TaxID=454156 RepID=UPI0031F98E75
MTTARDIMHLGATCVDEHDTIASAAQRMRDLDIGALPVCGDNDRLHGILTDRDIVVRCVAEGLDPLTVSVGRLVCARPVTVEPDTDVKDVLYLMEEHRIRRLPVIDRHRLVGMISEADLARNMPGEAVGHFVRAVCTR